jgi:hypothetical protein
MNSKQQVATGLVAALLFGTIVLGDAAGRNRKAAAAPAPVVATASLVTPELPQDQVRDMTYN